MKVVLSDLVTAAQLEAIGITSPLSLAVLLKPEQVFVVKEIRKSDTERLFYLGEPFFDSTLIWVYESMVREAPQ